jgi:superfamily II DNA/RNA helicase
MPTNIDDYVHRIGRTGRAGNTGSALAFVNEKNAGLIRELREMLDENEQVVPPWLSQMSQYSGHRGGGRSGGGRGGGSSFGSRDVRYSKDSGGRRGGDGGTCDLDAWTTFEAYFCLHSIVASLSCRPRRQLRRRRRRLVRNDCL